MGLDFFRGKPLVPMDELVAPPPGSRAFRWVAMFYRTNNFKGNQRKRRTMKVSTVAFSLRP